MWALSCCHLGRAFQVTRPPRAEAEEAVLDRLFWMGVGELASEEALRMTMARMAVIFSES